jgi:hypothetical protein
VHRTAPDRTRLPERGECTRPHQTTPQKVVRRGNGGSGAACPVLPAPSHNAPARTPQCARARDPTALDHTAVPSSAHPRAPPHITAHILTYLTAPDYTKVHKRTPEYPVGFCRRHTHTDMPAVRVILPHSPVGCRRPCPPTMPRSTVAGSRQHPPMPPISCRPRGRFSRYRSADISRSAADLSTNPADSAYPADYQHECQSDISRRDSYEWYAGSSGSAVLQKNDSWSRF